MDIGFTDLNSQVTFNKHHGHQLDYFRVTDELLGEGNMLLTLSSPWSLPLLAE